MELKQLTYFTAVTEEGSISAAAKRLYMSQPPLSQQMQLLEKELGCILFERGARKIQLTDAGRLLYHRAQTLLELRRTTEEELRSISDGDNGVVRLGVVSSVICSRAAVWINDFHVKYPGVHFELSEANTYRLIEGLENGLIQMAVIRTPYTAEGLESTSLMSEELVCVTKDDERVRVTMEDLAKVPLILYRRWQEILRQSFNERDLKFNPVCIADDARTCVSLAEEGLGAAIVPASAANKLRGAAALPIEDLKLRSEIILLTKPGVYLPKCAKNFLSFIREL